MKEYCTILFTNQKMETAAIVVASFTEGDKFPEVVRHAKHKNREYEKAFLLTENGFLEVGFFPKSVDRGNEVQLVLKDIQSCGSIGRFVKATELFNPKRVRAS